ncbi:hypothetical protein BLNAU_11710 [Blattamonas nauphoetae]|uniref:Uncharacterized protein n=1 Tax=Blattamonas nauphoetae TaxID=2049346 RepID=A0ABQ9XR93_9EUKA|nr:hypothetical protein BLNAU_11710 [Blattamonas nauphoetae]
MIDSLKELRTQCEAFVTNGWNFFGCVTYQIANPHKSSFQTIILDDPSFSDIILNSLKLPHNISRETTLINITNITIIYPWIKEQFMKANLVVKMFETVDFVSLHLSESNTLVSLTNFIRCMFYQNGDNEEGWFQQYPLIRVSVFEPAKKFITFMFHNSDKLILNEEDKTQLEITLCGIHNDIKNMELRSEEHDADIVSALVKWEIQTMVEMENETCFIISFQALCSRAFAWNRGKRERQKRREVLLR